MPDMSARGPASNPFCTQEVPSYGTKLPPALANLNLTVPFALSSHLGVEDVPGGPEGGLVLLGEVCQLEALPRQLLRVRQAAHTHLAVSAAADLLDALRGIVAGLARFLAWPVD